VIANILDIDLVLPSEAQLAKRFAGRRLHDGQFVGYVRPADIEFNMVIWAEAEDVVKSISSQVRVSERPDVCAF
jgi:hypothetical protein